MKRLKGHLVEELTNAIRSNRLKTFAAVLSPGCDNRHKWFNTAEHG